MRVATVQMNSGADPATNFRALRPLLENVADEGAELVVLPENFALMGVSHRDRSQLAEADGAGIIQDRVADFARTYKMWIVAGTIPIRSPDAERPYASCCVYDAHGERIARYDKIHLFDVALPDGRETYAESSFTTPGKTSSVIATPWGRVGIAVCYDLRFPEQFRAMASTGMDMIALPAAFTRTTGQAHWESLLRSRAIENQCCLVAAAQSGQHPDGRSTWGHSMIIDAWGRIQADLGANTGAACVSIDLSMQQNLRKEFPALEHRRPDLFTR